MKFRAIVAFFLLLGGLGIAGPSVAQSHPDLSITPVVTGLKEPWALALLPEGGLIVTERAGRLLLVRDGEKTVALGNVPKVVAKGQGGLLDITLARDFETSRTLFLTFSKRVGQGSSTALARAQLMPGATALQNVKVLFHAKPGVSGGIHFGSRVVQGPDGRVFLTLGDRRQSDLAQDLSRAEGSVLRLNPDGTVPGDNPFVGQSGHRPEIWSYGHRNPQGAGMDAKGNLWVSEHGARGGDEVNLIRKGANFGWPVISYGRHYSGAKIGEGTSKPGMQQPAHYWDPSIAPSGLMVYSGDLFAKWRGDIFVGSLKFDYLARLTVTGKNAREVQQIKTPETIRVRDVVQADDGAIWFISVGNGAVYRMTPKR